MSTNVSQRKRRKERSQISEDPVDLLGDFVDLHVAAIFCALGFCELLSCGVGFELGSEDFGKLSGLASEVETLEL